MLTLAFDTSQGGCRIVLFGNNGILHSFIAAAMQSQVEALVPSIEKVLSSASVKYADLDFIVTTRGPGSFTGIRVGLATIQGICAACRATPMVACSANLWRTHMQSINSASVDLVVLRAYANYFYLCTFYAGEQDHREVKTLIPQEIVAYVESILMQADSVCIAGSDLSAVAELLKNKERCILLEFDLSAEVLYQFALRQVQIGKAAESFAPLYIKEPSIRLA